MFLAWQRCTAKESNYKTTIKHEKHTTSSIQASIKVAVIEKSCPIQLRVKSTYTQQTFFADNNWDLKTKNKMGFLFEKSDSIVAGCEGWWSEGVKQLATGRKSRAVKTRNQCTSVVSHCVRWEIVHKNAYFDRMNVCWFFKELHVITSLWRGYLSTFLSTSRKGLLQLISVFLLVSNVQTRIVFIRNLHIIIMCLYM